MLKAHTNSRQSPKRTKINPAPDITRACANLELAQANQELALALAEAARELTQANDSLARTRGELKHETMERALAEESLTAAMTGKRTFYWYAAIDFDPVLGENILRWDLHMANEEVVKRWLPIDYGPGENLQASFIRAVSSADRQRIDLHCHNALATRLPGYTQDFRLIAADGDIIWLREEVTIESPTRGSWSLVGKCTDITGLKHKEEQAFITDANSQLQALAFQDELTGLHNRRAFHDQLVIEFERAKLYRTPLSVIMLDVDNFKDYNDTYGHPAGDITLKNVARLLRENARSVDFTARFGGEEFIIVTPADQ